MDCTGRGWWRAAGSAECLWGLFWDDAGGMRWIDGDDADPLCDCLHALVTGEERIHPAPTV